MRTARQDIAALTAASHPVRARPQMVRPYASPDFDHLVRRWHDTNRITYPYVEAQQRHTLDAASAFFRDEVLATCEHYPAPELEPDVEYRWTRPSVPARRAASALALPHCAGLR